MKNILLQTVIILLFNVAGFAQKDDKAKEILDKSSAAFSAANAMSANFTINIKDTSKKLNVSYEGKIDIKGTKFHIDIPDHEIWFNGKTQWVLQKDWNEVSITEPDEQETQTLNPGVIFSIYKKGCKHKYLGEKSDAQKRKIHEIELIPQNKENGMAKIILQINVGDWMPVMFHIYFTNEIENIVHINKYKTKMSLSDNLFVFDAKKHPEVEINDLRN
ncbi:MAG: outer-membrane lipoprotein carrier protein LolA [Dysgonamonadaceae bacterium]|jgi:outer membrane lipoprotein-sorting protein|nr:outer-membrane lipoprotein carrier protein LolA [Dysgonamonadaceae bacterium]